MKYKIINRDGASNVHDNEKKISIPMSGSNPLYRAYLEWVSQGNVAEIVDMNTPEVHIPTDEEVAIEARKTAAKLLKDKVKNKDGLSKNELATILATLMDLIS